MSKMVHLNVKHVIATMNFLIPALVRNE